MKNKDSKNIETLKNLTPKYHRNPRKFSKILNKNAQNWNQTSRSKDL